MLNSDLVVCDVHVLFEISCASFFFILAILRFCFFLLLLLVGFVGDGEWEDISGDGGILKKVLTPGVNDVRPPDGANVFCHYVGTLTSNGDKFDSSRDRDSPFNFPLGQGRVIRGWDEGIATYALLFLCHLRLLHLCIVFDDGLVFLE